MQLNSYIIIVIQNKIKLYKIMQADLFSNINGSFYIMKPVFQLSHEFTNDVIFHITILFFNAFVNAIL